MATPPTVAAAANILSYARKCKFCTLTVYFTFLLCGKCNVHCWHVVQHLNESKFKLMHERDGTVHTHTHSYIYKWRDWDKSEWAQVRESNPILSLSEAISSRAMQFIWTCLNRTFYHRFGGDDVCHFFVFASMACVCVCVFANFHLFSSIWTHSLPFRLLIYIVCLLGVQIHLCW